MSNESIEPVSSTIGVALAPTPSPTILAIGGIHVLYFAPTGSGRISS